VVEESLSIPTMTTNFPFLGFQKWKDWSNESNRIRLCLQVWRGRKGKVLKKGMSN